MLSDCTLFMSVLHLCFTTLFSTSFMKRAGWAKEVDCSNCWLSECSINSVVIWYQAIRERQRQNQKKKAKYYKYLNHEKNRLCPVIEHQSLVKEDTEYQVSSD